jgi:cellulose biosynthesis protein BcsQ
VTQPVRRSSAAPLPWFERSVGSGLSALATIHEQVSQRPTVLPLSSAVGGAGTTTVLASLGRALSILGERVLLADADAPTTLDYSFRAQSEESALLLSTKAFTTFEGQVHVLRTGHHLQGVTQSGATRMQRAVAELRGRLDRIIVSGREVLTPAIAQQARVDGVCLVVVTPELRSLVALPAIIAAFQDPGARGGVKPYFVLNRFEQANPAHCEFRDLLAAELRSQLLPFCIPESTTVAQSLAERVSPLDIGPQSAFAEACFNLAEWYRAKVGEREPLSREFEENQLVSE